MYLTFLVWYPSVCEMVLSPTNKRFARSSRSKSDANVGLTTKRTPELNIDTGSGTDG